MVGGVMGASHDLDPVSVDVEELRRAIVRAAHCSLPLYAVIDLRLTDDYDVVSASAWQRCHDADLGTCSDEPYEIARATGKTIVGALIALFNVMP